MSYSKASQTASTAARNRTFLALPVIRPEAMFADCLRAVCLAAESIGRGNYKVRDHQLQPLKPAKQQQQQVNSKPKQQRTRS
jgi:hypothetical protein